MLIIVVFEKIKKKRNRWERERHYEDYNIFAALFRQLSFILLYNTAILIFICCCNQYSLACVKKKKKGNRRERKINAHSDTMKIAIFLLYSSDNYFLYCCTTLYSYLFICCCNQYPLMREMQYYTSLGVLCLSFSVN